MHTQKLGAAAILLLLLLSPASAFAGLPPARAGGAQAGTNLGVEETVRAYFTSTPVMSAIAQCESEFHQFNTDGSVLHGGYKHSMIGIFQIAPLHLPDTKALGFDVNTVAGNIAYAKHLYERQGTRPWLDSSHCWEKKMEALSAGEAAAAATTSAKIAMLQRQVEALSAALAALIAARQLST